MSVDLAKFPRLRCRRCGLVALVDPGLPLDARPSIRCPTCHIPLQAPRLVAAGAAAVGTAGPRGARAGIPALDVIPSPAAGVPDTGLRSVRLRRSQVPSNVAVGVALAGIVLVIMVAVFVYLLVTPHHPYWDALTR
ncbi:MAG TPA: hypothetical protein VG245_05910 [Candidatus Dormibacteraeota bacterium]|nr:hypothetical protein [Candidatus Dormibacteraeota bacterium]